MILLVFYPEQRLQPAETSDGVQLPPNKKRSEGRSQPVPDRWGLRQDQGERPFPIFVGEYKAAYKLRAESTQRALSSPSESLFLDVLKRMQSSKVDSEQEKTKKKVA